MDVDEEEEPIPPPDLDETGVVPPDEDEPLPMGDTSKEVLFTPIDLRDFEPYRRLRKTPRRQTSIAATPSRHSATVRCI